MKDFFWKILGFCFDLFVCYVSFLCNTLSVLEVQLLSAGEYSAENGEITKMHQSEYLKKQNKTMGFYIIQLTTTLGFICYLYSRDL